jgi:hypothetical protein
MKNGNISQNSFARTGKTTRAAKTALVALIVCAVLCNLFCNIGIAASGAENVLSYWPLDGSAEDASGRLALSGSNPAFEQGVHDKALDLVNGTAVRSQKLACNTVRGFTMGAWFSLDAEATEWNIIMSKGNTGDAGADRFQIHIGHASEEAGGGYLLAYVPAVGGIMSTENDGQFVPFDTWTFATLTYDGMTLKMYVNGELALEREAPGKLGESIGTYNTVTVGALNHDPSSLQFRGLIDDAFYANYTMTAEDVKAAYDDAGNLKAWADGTKPIVPAEMASDKDPVDPTADPGTEATPDPGTQSGGDGIILFWPFERSTVDVSHFRLNIDSEGDADSYVDGKAGKGLASEFTLLSGDLPDELDMQEFTVALWVKWSENSHGTYAVLFAAAGKETNHHFELYYTVDGDDGELAFYATSTGWNVEHIAPVARDEYFHVAAVNGANGFKLFLNGELVYSSPRIMAMPGFGSADDIFSICGLVDRTLTCAGEYDELLVANYALDEELVKKLYSDPEAAQADVLKLVEANYPEGYEPPTAVPEPTATPTAAPTEEPTPVNEDPTDNGSETAAPTAAERTPVPGKTPGTDNKSTDSSSKAPVGLIIAIASGVLIAACVIAAVLIMKKKK